MSSDKSELALARNIAALRDALGLSKVQFAKELGVSRIAVLQWENGREPGTKKYVDLANLASEIAPSCALWFWEKAGVHASVLRKLVPEVEKLLKRHEARISGLRSDREVRLPLLDESFFEGGHESVRARLNALSIETSGDVESAAFPLAVIPNRGATIAVRAPDDHMRYVFCQGDIIAVDTSSGTGPGPFGTPQLGKEFEGGQIVAAYYKPAGRKSGSLRAGLHLRRLWVFGSDAASLKLETDIGREFEIVRPFVRTHGEAIHPVVGSEEVNITGNPEWSVLGRVVAWIGSQWQQHFAQRDHLRRRS